MASYRKRPGGTYAEVRRKGIYRARTFRTKTAAKKWAEQIEARIDAGLPMDPHSVTAALRRYAEQVSPLKRGKRWEVVRLKAFERDAFAKLPIADVQASDISLWRDRRLERVARTTVRREMTLLKSVFEIARKEWQWIDVNPMTDVSKPANKPPRDQLISSAQAQAVYHAAGYFRGMNPRTRTQLTAAALDLALETAMRAGEIRSLNDQTINLDQRFVTLPETKNGKARDVPLSSAAVEILKSLDSPPFPMSAQSLDVTFRKLKDKAGLKGAFTFHDARATAITHLAKKLDIHDLARMTGHSDLSQLLRYYRASAAEIAGRLG